MYLSYNGENGEHFNLAIVTEDRQIKTIKLKFTGRCNVIVVVATSETPIRFKWLIRQIRYSPKFPVIQCNQTQVMLLKHPLSRT